MSKEDKLLSSLASLLIEFKACYSATEKEEKELKKLFSSYNNLLKIRYGA